MRKLIDDSNRGYQLGHASMDGIHRKFIALINQLDRTDDKSFLTRFKELIAHTEEHFSSENALMQETDFPAAQEHINEHRRVLMELHQICEQVASGNIAAGRAYIKGQLSGWFKLHTIVMDNALVAHANSSQTKVS